MGLVTGGFEPRDYDNVKRFPVKTGETIAECDMTALDANGEVILALAATAKLLGPAARGTAITSAAAGTTIDVHCDPRATYRCLCDNAAENLQATVGDEVDLIGATGSMLVNLGASATDVFTVQEIGAFRDPTGLADSTTRWCNGQEIFVKITDGKHSLGN